MKLRHLRYLVAVADAGTFGRAAEQLHVAQPALSRQLRDLAVELQVPLFARGAPRATLTSAGRVGVSIARDVIRGAESAVRRARLSQYGLVGPCVLAVGPLAVRSGCLARLVARVKAKYPDIDLSVIEAGASAQWDALVDGRADIGLGVPPPASYSKLVSELQYLDVVNVALVAPEHPLAKRGSVPLATLLEHHLFMLEDTGSEPDKVKRQIMQTLRERGISRANATEVPCVESLLAHVSSGRGWTFMPRRVMSRFAPLVPVSIDDLEIPFEMSRVWRSAEARPVVHTVLDELRLMQLEARSTEGPGRARQDNALRQPAAEFVSPRLELQHVRSFTEVARRGTLGRAAESLHISQPALSRQMNDLEHDVGVLLLRRGKRGVELTPPGSSFLKDIAPVLSAVDNLRSQVTRAQRGSTGECLMGVVAHVYVDRIVSDALARLGSQSSGLQITARALTTPQLSEAIIRSDIDLAIGYAYPMPMPQDGLERRLLFEDEMNGALLPDTHPLASRESLSLAELSDVPFLFPSRALLPRLFDAVMHQFSAANVTPTVLTEGAGAFIIWSLTAQGTGWSLGTRAQVTEPPAGTRCVPLRDFHLRWGAEIVYRPDEIRSKVRSVIEAIVAAAATHRLPASLHVDHREQLKRRHQHQRPRLIRLHHAPHANGGDTETG